MDFSSWPRDQEQTFVVYEQHANESQKKALVVGIVSALAVLFVMLGIYAGVEPEKRDYTKGMNMSNLTKKSSKPAETKPAEAKPAPAPSPSGDGAAPKQ
jgi:hypothetical protein